MSNENSPSNQRSTQDESPTSSLQDPSDFQEPLPRTTDNTYPRIEVSLDTARSHDPSDNQIQESPGLLSPDSPFLVFDEQPQLPRSPSSQSQIFSDSSLLPVNLTSPQRAILSPNSLARQRPNRTPTPRRQVSFRLPNTGNSGLEGIDQVLGSEDGLQTNLERIVTSRRRLLSEQTLHSGQQTSPVEHQRRRRRHLTGSPMSAAQQQQFMHLNQRFLSGDGLVIVPSRLDNGESQRPERQQQLSENPVSAANRRLQYDQVPDSESSLRTSLERITITSRRRLLSEQSLHNGQQTSTAEHQRRRRRHLTGSPMSATQQQQFTQLTEQFLSGNDLVIASNSQRDGESERPERRRHLSGSHLPGFEPLQLVNLNQLFPGGNDSVIGSSQPSDGESCLEQHEQRCEKHRNSTQGESRMGPSSAIKSSRKYKRSYDENIPPLPDCRMHHISGENQWELSRDQQENPDQQSHSHRQLSPRTNHSLQQQHHGSSGLDNNKGYPEEEVSPKRHKSKHQEQSAVIPKKQCSTQLRQEPLQDIQNVDRDQSDTCRECQRITAERENNVLMFERFRRLLRESIQRHSNRPLQPSGDEHIQSLEGHSVEGYQHTVEGEDYSCQYDDMLQHQTDRQSLSEELCHPHAMDEHFEQSLEEHHSRNVLGNEHLSLSTGEEERHRHLIQEEHHRPSVGSEDHLYYAVGEQQHQFSSVEEEHHQLQFVQVENHPQLEVEGEQSHRSARYDFNRFLEDVARHHQNPEEEEEEEDSQNSRE